MSHEELVGKRAGELSTRVTSSGFDWISFIGRVGLYKTSDETTQPINDNGKYIHIVAVQIGQKEVAFSFIDITHQVGQLKLHEHLFELTPTPIVVLSLEGLILKANQEWLALFDYTPEYLTNKSLLDFIHPEGIDSLKTCLGYEDKDRYTCTLVNKVRANDDSYIEISWKAYHARNYILAVGIDISQIKKKERVLRRQIETHAMFMSSTITGVFQMMFDDPFDISSLSDSPESLDMYMKNERVVSVNDAFASHYNKTREALIGQTIYDMLSMNGENGREYFKQSILIGNMNGEICIKLIDGSFTHLYVDITTLKDSKGRVVGHMGLQIDINERKKSEAALKKSEQQFRLLGEYASDMIWVSNFDTHNIIYVSPAVTRILGWSVEEIQDNHFTKTVCEVDAKMAKKKVLTWAIEYRKTKIVNSNWSLQLRHYSKKGHVVWIESSISFKENESGVIEVIGVSRDISEKKKAEADLIYTNYHDQLTNVFNRRYINEKLPVILRNRQFPLAIITCDINGLKLTNDVFGHSVGDALLINTGTLLQSFATKDDIVVREGGDEFLMLLSGTSKENAEQIIEQMKEKCKTIIMNNITLSLSFGISVMEHKDENYKQVYALSEHHLYQSKLIESSLYKEKIITRLMMNLFEKHQEIKLHSERVANLSTLLAKELGLDDHDLKEIYIAGKLHDIGKIVLDESFVEPSQTLTEEQQFLLHRHSELGFHIIKSAQHYGKIADWVLSHHERPDGKGYPRGLMQHQIPLQSHILHVANEFERACFSKNKDKDASIETVIQSLIERKGTMYDARVVDALQSLSLEQPKKLEGAL